MSLRYTNEPELILPDMICAWPGTANVAQIVAATLRNQLGATPFAEVDPHAFYQPRRIAANPKVLGSIKPAPCQFYVSRNQGRDIILFIGQAQPQGEDAFYTDACPMYRMANLILDVAERYRCRRIHMSGAAVAPIHHSMPPRVWAIPNEHSLAEELAHLDNVVLMSMMADGNSQGFISGFNGLLLDVARHRGIEAVCLMGEVPYYLQGFTQPYPAAARAVLQVLIRLLDLTLNLTGVKQLEKKAALDIETRLLPMLKDIDRADFQQKRTPPAPSHHNALGPITDKEQRDMLKNVEDLFIANDGHRRRLA